MLLGFWSVVYNERFQLHTIQLNPIEKLSEQLRFFFGHRSFVRNKTQTAVIRCYVYHHSLRFISYKTEILSFL